MASKEEFVRYVADQCSGAGQITYRKMFGEYGIYVNGKIFGLICNDRLFVKVTKAGQEAAPSLPLAAPYEGARLHFLVEEVDDREFLVRLIRATEQELPPPRPKRPKTKKQKDETNGI